MLEIEGIYVNMRLRMHGRMLAAVIREFSDLGLQPKESWAACGHMLLSTSKASFSPVSAPSRLQLLRLLVDSRHVT